MTKDNRARKVIVTSAIICALVLVGILGSYAFFISNGTNNPENISTNTGTLALIFADGNSAITESLEFGSSVEKTFTIENTGSLEGVAKINFEDLVNTYLEGSLTYTLSYSEVEDGSYTGIVTNENVPRSEESSTQALADGLTVPAGQKYFYKLTITLNYLDDIDQTADLNAILSTHFSISEGSKTLTSKDTLANLNLKVKEGGPDFALVATTDETADGLYALEDDYGTSYFYRGAVENNYVKFGDYYWRIIRINGDGSLRMIYDGTEAHANGTSNINRLALTGVAWNPTYNDNKYVGYMFGGKNGSGSTKRVLPGEEGYEDPDNAIKNETSSNIKTKLEEWYVTNIKEKGLDQYVSDSIFCNDRTVPGKSATGWSYDTGLGYGTNVTAYGATARSNVWNSDASLVQPNFKCAEKNDAFTAEDTVNGNGALEEKVGLITADEIVAAGSGKYYTTNRSYYLHKGYWYSSLSPCSYNSNVYVFDVYPNGNLDCNRVAGTSGGVAPVINLKAEYVKTLRGEGTMSSPYTSE